MMRPKGFTLIELMVVVAIIAVLTTIGLLAYSVVLKNGRDAKRKADLDSIRSAIEQYRADQFYYPQDSATCSNGTLAFVASCGLKNSDASKIYINEVPLNPVTSSTTLQYCYKPLRSSENCNTQAAVDCDNTTTNKCLSYCLYAKLENPPSGSINYPDGASIQGCGSATSANAYNYKVTPP